MYNKVIIILVFTIILYLIYQNYNNITYEQFVGLTAEDIAAGATDATITIPATTIAPPDTAIGAGQTCVSGNWWDNGPIKAIRSKLWGASYNLVYQPDGNINSPVLVPINNPESNAPAGCIAVSGTGWHQTEICQEDTVDQRWLIKKITNQSEFETIMASALDTNHTVGFTYGYRMDKVDYPFFLVVSSEHPGQALYYNGSALGVRPIGNYDDLKWDILNTEVKDPIATNKFNYYSKLTPELQMSKSSVTSAMPSATLSNQNLLNDPQAIKALLAEVLKQPNTNGEFGVSTNNGGLKININMDEAMVSQLAGSNGVSNNSTNSTNNATVIESFTNSNTSIYPKQPMDIAVSLSYSTANIFKPTQNSTENVTGVVSNNGNVQVPVQEIGPNGELITVGYTEMTMKNDTGRTLCDENACHPDMKDWLQKPYPCSGCVPQSNETW